MSLLYRKALEAAWNVSLMLPNFLKFFIFIAILKNSVPWRLIPLDSGAVELGQSQMSGPSESQPPTRGAHYLKFFVYHT